MSRYTALISKARRRTYPAFSGPAKTLEQRETKRRMKEAFTCHPRPSCLSRQRTKPNPHHPRRTKSALMQRKESPMRFICKVNGRASAHTFASRGAAYVAGLLYAGGFIAGVTTAAAGISA